MENLVKHFEKCLRKPIFADDNEVSAFYCINIHSVLRKLWPIFFPVLSEYYRNDPKFSVCSGSTLFAIPSALLGLITQ